MTGGRYAAKVPDLMAVDRIALSLAGVERDADGSTYRVNGRLLAWLWLERVDPKKRRVPNPGVIVIPVADEMDKQTLLGMGDEAIFTEPHYDGYPAVLVRLSVADPELLEQLIRDAWVIQTSKSRGRIRRG